MIVINTLNIQNINYFIGFATEFNREELYSQKIQLNSRLIYDRVFSTWVFNKEKENLIHKLIIEDLRKKTP